jgi:putative hydrolase of the HAD superfamily
MRHALKAVAFDLDGTLYPNYRLNIRLIPFLLKEWRLLLAFGRARDVLHKTGEIADNIRKGNFYERQAALTAEFLHAQTGQVQEKIETCIYRGWEQHFTKIKLHDHVLQTLSAFKNAGLKLGLLSDFPPIKKIESLGIDSFWDTVICSEEVGALKPNILSFLKLAQDLDINPGEILYVGNSVKYDITGAKLAGMQAALIDRCCSIGRKIEFNKNKVKPDFIFGNYRQLCNFVLN